MNDLKNIIIVLSTILFTFLFVFINPCFASTNFKVASYNIESPNFSPRDTTIEKVAESINKQPKVGIWALQEVLNQDELDQLTSKMGSNFKAILGNSGNQDRLAIVYDTAKFTEIDQDELSGSGGSRNPLVVHFQNKEDDTEFLLMNNHFNRSNEDKRNAQADFVRNWAKEQTLPTIITGDFNMDYDLDTNKGNTAFRKLNEDDILSWIRPDCLADNSCPTTGTQCNSNFKSILDAFFMVGSAQDWSADSQILPFNCELDSEGFPDHRIVISNFTT